MRSYLLSLTLLLFIVTVTSLYKIGLLNNLINPQEKSAITSNKSHNPGDINILIDLNEKRLYVILNGEILKKYPIASGKPDTPSPLGDFTVIEKGKWGEGFGVAWLGLDVPWGKYGIHGTTRPDSIGRAASHGCIRMRNEDVTDLYKTVKVGTPVKIISGIYGMMGNGFRTLCPGDRGADVLVVQKKLKELGFYKGQLDGIYGTQMERALNKFQKSKHTQITNKINRKIYGELGIILFE